MQRLLGEAHALARDWWDPARRLLTHPGGLQGASPVAAGRVGLPTATAWWAYGLLARAQPGDRELAASALRGVIAQHDGAEGLWGATGDGVVARRTVVGAALALVVRDHGLPDQLGADVRAAVEGAVRGVIVKSCG